MTIRKSVTQQGNDRAENRDAHGAAQNAGVKFYIIADGATAKPDSGHLARGLVEFMVEAVGRTLPSTSAEVDVRTEQILDLLDQAHRKLCPRYPLASTSYLALLLTPGIATAVYAGDCCLGTVSNARTIDWLTPPHSLANWEGGLKHEVIAASPCRHRLFNVFSCRREHEPTVMQFPSAPGSTWVLATDGFWAGVANDLHVTVMGTQGPSGYIGDDDATFMVVDV